MFVFVSFGATINGNKWVREQRVSLSEHVVVQELRVKISLGDSSKLLCWGDGQCGNFADGA